MSRLLKGIWTENPVLFLTLGLCPALAVTTSALTGLGMGVIVLCVLAVSNVIFSLLRKVVPQKDTLAVRAIVLALLAAVAELVTKAAAFDLASALGVYLPLVAVNTLIWDRAEQAAEDTPANGLLDGVGMGVGFCLVLTLVGLVRELLGAGTAFGAAVMPDFYQPMNIFLRAPGALMVLAFLLALANAIRNISSEKEGESK